MTDPIIELIVTEEKQRMETTTKSESKDREENNESGIVVPDFDEEEDDDLIIFIEERDKVLMPGVGNRPSSEDTLDDLQQLPVKDKGKLENFVLIADKSDFEIRLEIDDHNIIDDTYNFISGIQNELSKISAYERNNQYIVSALDYEFTDRLNILIKPISEPINFPLIRVEVERDVE